MKMNPYLNMSYIPSELSDWGYSPDRDNAVEIEGMIRKVEKEEAEGEAAVVLDDSDLMEDYLLNNNTNILKLL